MSQLTKRFIKDLMECYSSDDHSYTHSKLRDKGYNMTKLGGGAYSTVYAIKHPAIPLTKDGSAVVLKLSRSRDAGCFAYLSMCRRLGKDRHSWMPKIMWMGSDDIDDLVAAVMPQYSPSTPTGDHWSSANAPTPVKNLRKSCQVDCLIDNIVTDINERYSSHVFEDIHDGNVMFTKKGKPIVTDPIAGG